MGRCFICKKTGPQIASILSLCGDCIKKRFSEVEEHIENIHKKIKEKDGIFYEKDKSGLQCNLCFNNCLISKRSFGYCGLRKCGSEGLEGANKNFANLEFYFDLLPTNCVASFCCAVSNSFTSLFPSPQMERCGKNLAIFFNGCSFNCLFCQNYQHREGTKKFRDLTELDELIGAIDNETACICFFGGDPSCQIDFTIDFAKKVLKLEKYNHLTDDSSMMRKICWETNGSFHPRFREDILNILFASGGTIKFDVKFFSEELNKALCGKSNKTTLENLRFFANHFSKRINPPILCVSTLVIPGYVDEKEIEAIAKFISSFHKDVPYSLLAFWPTFYLHDLPRTPEKTMSLCYETARKFLSNVHIGNKHLLT